jgi:hypothetical protein
MKKSPGRIVVSEFRLEQSDQSRDGFASAWVTIDALRHAKETRVPSSSWAQKRRNHRWSAS